MSRPYVSLFWSYRIGGETCVFTNWLTRRSVETPAATLDDLEAIHRGACAGVADERIHDLGIVFESAEQASASYEAMERQWQVAFPSIDQIELTNRCPYTCGMCPRTEFMDRPLGDMPLSLFESIIGQISGFQQYVALHHFGESLVYPRLPSAVQMACRMGVQTGLSCNPPSLGPTLAARLLDAGISNIVLSLDSLDSRTYEQIRGPAARLDLANHNLRELLRLRNEGGYPTGITLQMINMRANQDEAARFLDYCAELGVDRGVVVRLGRWDFDDRHFRVLGEFTTPGYSGYCSRPWTSVTVLWDGRVVPCCHDYNGAVVLGDLRIQSLREIWSSASAREFRQQNREYDLCTHCAFSRWYREKQREREGFRVFHCDRTSGKVRYEWFNPASSRRDTRHLFDEFDIMTVSAI
jgi:radical SAM protein with 4Fe4S-binding SPASM domain